MTERVAFILNGKPVSVMADSSRMLLWVLRLDLALTGTKFGCGEGYCGSCTVLIDGEARRSCQTSLKEVENRSVTTIEGMFRDGALHPLQKAFMDHDALQCGYCTPGMIMTAADLLNRNPHPTEKQIRDGMEDNLCRCGAHKRIIEAIQAASEEMGG